MSGAATVPARPGRLKQADIRRAVLVAAVVGPILTLINQHDALMAGAGPDWSKTALTFCVPFCVSLFSSWRASMGAFEESDATTAAEEVAAIASPEPQASPAVGWGTAGRDRPAVRRFPPA
ncbi:MAG: nitrate/nitrite transporter NrtS [Alphaproteobacteria bacterium]|nr:nitrate/nitrite transporter NrtS [Alphaproteobacteria bacterium]